MAKLKNDRETVLKASRAYYAHQAYYEDLLTQRRRRVSKFTKLELDFLEHIFHHETRQIRDVLDIACGNGRHVIELASRGYQCTGFKEIKCYTNWNIKPPENRKAEVLIFVARKD